MISQMLNRAAVTGAVQNLVASLKYGSLDPTPELLAVMSGLQTAAMLPPGALSPKDRSVFVPTQEHVSLLQALVEELAESGKLEPARDGADGDDAPTSLVLEPLKTAERPPLATTQLVSLYPDGSADEGWGDFNLTDAQWAKVVDALVTTHGERRRFRLEASPPEPCPLAEDARVILVGDWGNGGPDARAVATEIRRWMHTAEGRECHVIHLGDVYYAGTPWEAQNRFLDCWPVLPAEADRYRSWTLNGNHDMYAAGRGLMTVTLVDPRFSRQRATNGKPTTQFHLKGQDWQILGLDSAWQYRATDVFGHHGHLGEEQVSWMADCAADPQLGTILLSHHQPFTRKKAYPAPLSWERHFLGETLDARTRFGIEAWFWGHEHRCISYNPPEDILGLGYGACVGHGAMPEPPGDPIAGPTEWELLQNQPQRDIDGEYWRMCGFAVIDFAPGESPRVRYLDQSGESCKSEPDELTYVIPPSK